MSNTAYSDEKQTAKAGALNSIANFLSLFSSILLVPIISRILSAEDLGKAAAFVSAREIVFAIASFSIAQSVHLAMIDYSKEKVRYTSSVFMFASICITAIFLCAFLFKRQMMSLFFGSDFLFYWFFLLLFFQLAFEIGLNYVNFHNIYKISFVFALLTNPIPFVMSVALILNFPANKYTARILGLDSFIFLAGLIFIVAILVKGKFYMSMEHVKYGLRMSIPLIPYMLSAIVLMRSNILITSYFQGDDKAGIYTMSFTIAITVFAMMAQILKNWSPWVYRKLDADETEPVYNSSKHLVMFAFIASSGFMLVMPELVGLFVAPEYFECIIVSCPIIAGMFFRILYQLFYDVEYSLKKTNFNAISSVLITLLNIMLSILLIRAFGYISCAVSLAFCYGVLALSHYFYARKVEKRKIYNLQCILVCSIAIIFLCALTMVALNYRVIRYSFLLVTVAVVVYFERDFIAVFKDAIFSRINIGPKK